LSQAQKLHPMMGIAVKTMATTKAMLFFILSALCGFLSPGRLQGHGDTSVLPLL
jgi:hypothetical protein